MKMAGEITHDVEKGKKYAVYGAGVHIHGVRNCWGCAAGTAGGTVFLIGSLLLHEELQADGGLV